MALFQYIALDGSGQRVAGLLAGNSEQAVLVELEARQLVPVSISPRKEPIRLFGRGVSTRTLAMSYLQLADLLKAGVPLLRGLRLLGARKSQPRLAGVFRELADGVAEGGELADIMTRHPAVFPRIHVAMVRAGEKGGFLDGVFARLGQFVMGQAELRGKVLANLFYPALLVLFGTGVIGVIFGVFIPKFRPMFAQIPRLPLITHFVFGASTLVERFGLVTLVVVVVGAVTLWRLSRRPAIRRKITEVRTHMPVLGPLVRNLAAARFCRMFGTMLANGIPVLTAMQISKEAAGNILMEEAIDRATESVRAGQALSGPLADSRLFGDDVVEMIAVAESANNLDDVLVTIAETIEGRVDRLLTGVVRLIEPLLLMLIAAVVVVVAAGLILPMTQLSAGM